MKTVWSCSLCWIRHNCFIFWTLFISALFIQLFAHKNDVCWFNFLESSLCPSLPIDYLTSDPASMFQASEMCSEHPDRRREYFCDDCSASMCADCGVLGVHPGHKLERLHIVNQRIKPTLLETRARAGKTLDLIHQTKKVCYVVDVLRISFSVQLLVKYSQR